MKRSLIFGSIFIVLPSFVLPSFVVPSFVVAQTGVFLREDFDDLKNWGPLYFLNIDRHTRYAIVKEGSESYLKAESHASASGLIFVKEFYVYEYPKMRWRWKVNNVYHKGDALTKAGDDYPMRIFIMFKHASDKTAPMDFLGHGIAKLIFADNLPHSSLDYVWANREQTESILTSPYTDRVKMIAIEKGTANLGRWLEEEVNIVTDYELAFNQKPPQIAELAIMNDSDNTGESSVSYIDWIELSK
jgi:hypothetical protein